MYWPDILSPMNHREIEYYAEKLSGCEIPDVFSCAELLEWLDEMGKKLFDKDLIMDYGTDCLRLYLLFEKTPKENDAPYYDSWQEGALEGIYKFLARYRRMILAAAEWNRCGNYTGMVSEECFVKMQEAIADARSKIDICISQGNTLPNRHRIVVSLMELLKVLQKELRIGEIVSALHTNAIQTAVPHGQVSERKPVRADVEETIQKNIVQEEAATQICADVIAMMSPFAPSLSRVLWEDCKFI